MVDGDVSDRCQNMFFQTLFLQYTHTDEGRVVCLLGTTTTSTVYFLLQLSTVMNCLTDPKPCSIRTSAKEMSRRKVADYSVAAAWV
jgi:hypothetical protein